VGQHGAQGWLAAGHCQHDVQHSPSYEFEAACNDWCISVLHFVSTFSAVTASSGPSSRLQRSVHMLQQVRTPTCHLQRCSSYGFTNLLKYSTFSLKLLCNKQTPAFNNCSSQLKTLPLTTVGSCVQRCPGNPMTSDRQAVRAPKS
jgi:hypothetical protein